MGDFRTKLVPARRPDGWWVESSVPGVSEFGPYKTRKLLEQDRKGVLAWCRRNRRLLAGQRLKKHAQTDDLIGE
jgi:hypothetical protein